MAYYGYEFYYNGTRATFWGYMQVALINMDADEFGHLVKHYHDADSCLESYEYRFGDKVGDKAHTQKSRQREESPYQQGQCG